MQWIVQSNFIRNDQVVEITDALKAHSIPFVTCGILPFTRDVTLDDPARDFSEFGTKLIPYGSTSLLRTAQQRGWEGLCFREENFDVDFWNKVRHDMLNNPLVICTVAEAAEWARRHDPRDLFFIRPVGDFKLFAGAVSSAAEIVKDMSVAQSGNFSFTPEDKVAISIPRNIQAEWRWFIVDGKIVTGSTYRMRGQPYQKRETDIEVIAEAQKMADVWLPYHSAVMDLALVDDQMKVVEFNCINGSGFYDCDISAIFSALDRKISGRP